MNTNTPHRRSSPQAAIISDVSVGHGRARALNASRGSGSWTDRKVDEEDYIAFMDSLQRDGHILILNQTPIGGGYSGARTSSLLVDGTPAHPNNRYGLYGHYILKVCHERDGKREDAWHAIASRSETLEGHIPDVHRPLISRPRGKLVGIFYRVAGGTILKTKTLKDHAGNGAPAPAYVDAVGRALLSYNRSVIPEIVPRKDQVTDPQKDSNVFAEIRDGIGSTRIEDLRLAVDRVLDKPQATYISLPPRLHNSFPLLNPCLYMDPDPKMWPAQPRKHAILKGPLHGDLHPGNIIVPTGAQSDQWFLIDFATGRYGNALFDLAFFELSILLNVLCNAGSDDLLTSWWDLEKWLRAELCPNQNVNAHTASTWQLLASIGPLRQAIEDQRTREQQSDHYWITFLAASVEAGLRYTRILQGDPRGQTIAFSAASRFHFLSAKLGVMDQISSQYFHPSYAELRQETSRSHASDEHHSAENGKTYSVMPWPAEVTRETDLFDPIGLHTILETSLRRGQGILLEGERRSGKFRSCEWQRVVYTIPMVASSVSPLTLLDRLDIGSFAFQVLELFLHHFKVKPASLGVVVRNGKVICKDQQDVPNLVVTALEKMLGQQSAHFILFIDEFDSVLRQARSAVDATLMVRLVSRLAKIRSETSKSSLHVPKSELSKGYPSARILFRDCGIWRSRNGIRLSLNRCPNSSRGWT